ncbi:MAG: hypothetical protein ABEJ44_02120 [Halanaeroarchaeum sp.]
MNERGPSRDTIRQLAGRVATTEHAALDEGTIHDVVDAVRDVDERVRDEGSATAIRDLLTFWEAYVSAALGMNTSENPIEGTGDLPRLIERGNDADLFGLDLYQGLLQLSRAYEAEDDGENVAERTVRWAERVSGLTREFVVHLEDHL